jgi:hypothetical protein
MKNIIDLIMAGDKNNFLEALRRFFSTSMEQIEISYLFKKRLFYRNTLLTSARILS